MQQVRGAEESRASDRDGADQGEYFSQPGRLGVREKDEVLRNQTDRGQKRASCEQLGECPNHQAGFQPAGKAAHHQIENEEVRDRHQARGKREPAMPELEVKGEEPVQAKIHRDGTEADQHRQIPLIERIEGGREDFDGGITDEPDRVKPERFRGVRGRVGGKPAVLINEADDRLRQNHEADGGWNREQHDEPHGVRERAAKFFFVAQRGAARNERERDGRDRDAENAERQLHETKGNVQPRHRSIAECRSEPAVHGDVYLHRAGRDGGRAHQRENGPHAGITPIEVGRETKTDPA